MLHLGNTTCAIHMVFIKVNDLLGNCRLPVCKYPCVRIQDKIHITYFCLLLEPGKVQCQYCEKWIHKGTITRHIRHQHQQGFTVSCQYCSSQYKNEASLSNHLRIKHNVFSK